MTGVDSQSQRTFSEKDELRSKTFAKGSLLGDGENQNEDDRDSFDELEDEAAIEEQLAALTARIERFKGQDRTMRIGTNQFEINDKDPIFFLNGPNRKEIRTGACVSCRDTVFESNSDMKFCHFCGNSNCEKCMQKERMFPRGRINADGQKPRGQICKLCDRKFLMRQMQLDTSVAITKSR